MPYIKQEDRERLKKINLLEDDLTKLTEGELTYVFYRICLNAIPEPAQDRYRDYHRVIGCLESTKLEFYRQWVSDYERGKILENGDIE